MMMKMFGHPIPGFESFVGWSQIMLKDMGSSSIGYSVYSRRLNNNGLKILHIGICIDSKALWKKWTLLTNSDALSEGPWFNTAVKEIFHDFESASLNEVIFPMAPPPRNADNSGIAEYPWTGPSALVMQPGKRVKANADY
ncbi:hypothetical protein ACTXT7_005225 [Hymenolepis weldensis]